MHLQINSYEDIHLYALNINNELDRLRKNHKSNEVRIIFDETDIFVVLN